MGFFYAKIQLFDKTEFSCSGDSGMLEEIDDLHAACKDPSLRDIITSVFVDSNGLSLDLTQLLLYGDMIPIYQIYKLSEYSMVEVFLD